MQNLPKVVLPLLLAIGLLFYARSWSAYFVCDDYEFLGRINFSSASAYFGKSWAYGNEYRPLLPFSYALDAALSGENPLGYHITNTLIHVGSAYLLIRIGIALELPFWTASLAGLLYLLNPVAHEALLWISGRPVLLSAFLQLFAVWCLVAGSRLPPKLRLLASTASFIVALLIYEGAVALPFVLLVLWAVSAQARRRYRLFDLVPFGLILAGYLSFWFWIFDFHLVRQRQDSLADGALCIGQAVLHSWHGAYRPEVAAVYCLALLWFLREKASRRLAAATLALFVAAFLPFFMSKGFAPRFAYFPSAPLCVLLASLVVQIIRSHKRMGTLALTTLLLFYGIGMQNLIGQWKTAGSIAQSIPQGIAQLEPNLTAGSAVAISGVPPMYKHAYVYLTGLQRSLTHTYGRSVAVIQTQDPVCAVPADAHFRYSGGKVSELRCAPGR